VTNPINKKQMKFYIQISILIVLNACQNNIEYKNENWPNGFPKTIVREENSSLDGTILIVKKFEEKLNDTTIYIVEKYYDNNQIAEKGMIEYGKKEGFWESWYKSGQKSVESNYNNDVRIGIYKSWYPNGDILEKFEYPNTVSPDL
jgi:antitoxin component YwqK of YwqJK toxin-antitoxin module